MSLDDLTDEQQAVVLRTIDEFARNRVYISKTPGEMRKTDHEIKRLLRGIYRDPKDVAVCLSIYDAKVAIYAKEKDSGGR